MFSGFHKAELNFCKLAKPVADFPKVPEEETTRAFPRLTPPSPRKQLILQAGNGKIFGNRRDVL